MRPDDEADEDGNEPEEQDLLVVLRLGNKQMGTAPERMAIEAFADRLEAAITEAGVGEYDGDELGGGECTLFFCGPDIDKLLGVLRPLLKRSPLCRGAMLVRMVDDGTGEFTPQRTPV